MFGATSWAAKASLTARETAVLRNPPCQGFSVRHVASVSRQKASLFMKMPQTKTEPANKSGVNRKYAIYLITHLQFINQVLRFINSQNISQKM